jgi:hypothetical protein
MSVCIYKCIILAFVSHANNAYYVISMAMFKALKTLHTYVCMYILAGFEQIIFCYLVGCDAYVGKRSVCTYACLYLFMCVSMYVHMYVCAYLLWLARGK